MSSRRSKEYHNQIPIEGLGEQEGAASEREASKASDSEQSLGETAIRARAAAEDSLNEDDWRGLGIEGLKKLLESYDEYDPDYQKKAAGPLERLYKLTREKHSSARPDLSGQAEKAEQKSGSALRLGEVATGMVIDGQLEEHYRNYAFEEPDDQRTLDNSLVPDYLVSEESAEPEEMAFAYSERIELNNKIIGAIETIFGRYNQQAYYSVICNQKTSRGRDYQEHAALVAKVGGELESTQEKYDRQVYLLAQALFQNFGDSSGRSNEAEDRPETLKEFIKEPQLVDGHIRDRGKKIKSRRQTMTKLINRLLVEPGIRINLEEELLSVNEFKDRLERYYCGIMSDPISNKVRGQIVEDFKLEAERANAEWESQIPYDVYW